MKQYNNKIKFELRC